MSQTKNKFINIKLQKNLYLMSDSLNFMLVKLSTNSKGETEKEILGYYSSLENALRGHAKKLTNICGAETLQELLTALTNIEKRILEARLG